MAKTAVARERLFALRETIARLEGKPVPGLAAAEQEALGEDGLSGRKQKGLHGSPSAYRCWTRPWMEACRLMG